VSIDRLLVTPCTITDRVRGTDDEWNNPTWDETTRDTVCHVNELATSEDVAPDARTEGRAVIFLAAGDTITKDASITVDGRTWQVDGPVVQRRRGTTGDVHHLEVPALEVT
jgi:hypothetical protein